MHLIRLASHCGGRCSFCVWRRWVARYISIVCAKLLGVVARIVTSYYLYSWWRISRGNSRIEMCRYFPLSGATRIDVPMDANTAICVVVRCLYLRDNCHIGEGRWCSSKHESQLKMHVVPHNRTYKTLSSMILKWDLGLHYGMSVVTAFQSEG